MCVSACGYVLVGQVSEEQIPCSQSYRCDLLHGCQEPNPGPLQSRACSSCCTISPPPNRYLEVFAFILFMARGIDFSTNDTKYPLSHSLTFINYLTCGGVLTLCMLKVIGLGLGIMVKDGFPVPGRLRQEAWEAEASLSFMKLCLDKQEQSKQKPTK